MLQKDHRDQVLFPHDEIRPVQDELLLSVEQVLSKGKHLVVHAPTGLGKTAATLGPAIAYAVENDLRVFFLTSRHTQHAIALETVKLIEDRHDVTIPVANLIGKKHMCLQPGVDRLYGGEFIEYCRKLREDKACSYYENVRNGNSLTTDMRVAVEKAKQTPASGKLRVIGSDHHVCPYEVGIESAKEARVIVTDYYYVFHPRIRDSFMSKIGASLDRSIVIVDEAHNIPDRVKDLASERVTNHVTDLAVREAEKFDVEAPVLARLQGALESLAREVDKSGQRTVERSDVVGVLGEYDLDALEDVADEIREESKRSFIGSVVSFLRSWVEPKEGFARILSVEDDRIVLTHRCLDPGIVAGPAIRETYSTILMSGTLTPTVMYAELLDVPLRSEEYTFKSPFPEENRLTMIVPQTTTKYAARSDVMYETQARVLAKMIDEVPGNAIVFFPSYYLRDQVAKTLEHLTSKTVLYERRGMSKQDREDILKKFRSHKLTGALLLGVMSGSFAEGIDLPGDELQGVFVVGLPLARPDLETKSLIKYYDEKFSRGWDYGYVFPAFNRILQSAGRCIRSETDRGVIVFLDERYAWRTYQRCFPPHWDLRMSGNPGEDIKKFFSQ